MDNIGCGQVWGGNRNVDMDLCTQSLETSLKSVACDGGKGGDIYYYSVCNHDKLSRIVLGDVVGHGNQVSAVSQWVYDSLLQHMNKLEGNNILTTLNNTIHDRGLDAMTTAAVIGYYLGDHNFYFSYAGHHPALVRRKGESEWWPATIDDTNGDPNIPLGIEKNIHYQQQHIQLTSGDCLFVYTDGVIETPNPDNHLFGVENLLSILNNIPDNDPQHIKEKVFENLLEFSQGNLNHDDVTAISIKIH